MSVAPHRVGDEGRFTAEMDFFCKNFKSLLELYAGKFLVIKASTLEGVYDTEVEAYFGGKDKFGLGGFMLQPCRKDIMEPVVFHRHL